MKFDLMGDGESCGIEDYYIGSVETPFGMSQEQAETVIGDAWGEFQAGAPEADSDFGKFLEGYGFKVVENEFVQVKPCEMTGVADGQIVRYYFDPNVPYTRGGHTLELDKVVVKSVNGEFRLFDGEDQEITTESLGHIPNRAQVEEYLSEGRIVFASDEDNDSDDEDPAEEVLGE